MSDWIPESEKPFERAAIWRGEEWRSRVNGDAALRSIAISLKRFVDMVEEDRKPRLDIAPEGWVSHDEHQRILREGLAREVAAWERIASAIEARRAETLGSARESAVPEADAQKEQP